MLVYIKPLSLFPKLHSDTLFGALTSAISELFPDVVNEMIKLFEDNNPPFLLSSAFPYIINEKIRFYPKIINSNNENITIKNRDNLKLFKKIDFIEEEIFLDIINGKLSEEDILNNFEDYFSSKNLLMKDKHENIKFIRSVLPNNYVNRCTNESKIFYSDGEEYGNIGLFFFIELLDENYENIIRSALKFLKDRGFGRDISTGKGQFDYEIETISFYDLINCNGSNFITLSRFIPTDDDLDAITSNDSYELDSKRGRFSNGEIKKKVTFFKEGSRFKNNSKFHGRIVNSGTINPSIEYGFAFPVLCKGE